MTDEFINRLQDIVGHRHVLTGEDKTRRFATGYRYGGGRVLAVARPGTLVEQWRLLQACAAADKIVIMQAANTGLTGGSTPDGEGYDRDIVIINTLRLSKIRIIRDGRQVICFPGATLNKLEKKLKRFGREPHSVIGSSCIGASVTGGIANNSGGALVRRGPAYTQLALYARIHTDGHLELVNHLGVSLGGEAEEILRRLDHGKFRDSDIQDGGYASDHEYAAHVRMIDADTPARFNADPRRLFEASGCAGKLALFAVRLDTFEAEPAHKLFYIGCNDVRALADIRRHVLGEFKNLPVLGEYIHRDAFDVAEKYGKDTFLIINYLGTRFLPHLFALKGRIDGVFGKGFSDRFLQRLSKIFPSHLPERMKVFRDKFEHHLLLEMSGEGVAEAEAYLKSFFTFGVAGAYFECTESEKKKALLQRFAVAGAGVRYRAMHPDTVEDIVAFDIALRRNDRDWLEVLPESVSSKLVKALYCGHFLCHVFHQDYIVKKGEDCAALKQDVIKLLEARGAKYPAEHNVGHFYKAPANLAESYRALDPSNALNPGVGQTSKKKHWAA